MDTQTVTYMGEELVLIETYKGLNIVKPLDGDTIMVHNPVQETVFIVCMDDSKSCGYRKFDENYNTIEEARNHIDWLKR